MTGQMSIYDFLPNPEEEHPLREPCHRHCDVAWCSLTCFLRRGYIVDKSTGKWARRADGKILRTKNRECDWKTAGEIDFSCFSSWKNPENKNGIILGKCPKDEKGRNRQFQPKKKCEECEAHIRFYRMAEADRALNGGTWFEAIQRTKAHLEIENYYLPVPKEKTEGET